MSVIKCDRCGRRYYTQKAWGYCPHDRLGSFVGKAGSFVYVEPPKKSRAWIAPIVILVVVVIACWIAYEMPTASPSGSPDVTGKP